jgi:hypothetical protein
MRLLEIEAIIALVEHCRRYETMHAAAWFMALLKALGEQAAKG